MNRLVKLSVCTILALSLMLITAFADAATDYGFDDVPEGHWAEKAVNGLRSLKITEGIGNNKYGMGLEIKRSEFVTYLTRLMNWELVMPEKGSFTDNQDRSEWYYPYIETAYRHGVIPEGLTAFRPEDPITREEMAVMLVNTLGYGTLAQQLSNMDSGFDDVYRNTGYIAIARDFGIITGVGNNKFKPGDTAKREEAAVMMMRMYEKINKPVNELHAFYAIRSYPQINLIRDLDSVSFGWSRMEYDGNKGTVVLNTSPENGNSFYIPGGFTEPVNLAKESNVSAQLMVFADNNTLINSDGRKVPVLEYILTQPELRKQAVSLIAGQVNGTEAENSTISFDGVVIDFESMKGEKLKYAFDSFLEELKSELDVTGKKLLVAVHPVMKSGQEYYDGYDYRTIGRIADRVILMAHDYFARSLTEAEKEAAYTITPLTPIEDVYYALKAITDKESGVENPEKIWLQISFDSVQWNLQNGKVINSEPYRPGYEQIYTRLLKGVEMNYSDVYRNPYIKYTDTESQISSVIWYEESRSVLDKINLAKMFGVNGISVWRLGNIPNYADLKDKDLNLDVWQKILKEKER